MPISFQWIAVAGPKCRGDIVSLGYVGEAFSHGYAVTCTVAPIAQSAEAADLKSAQCEFESHWGHRKSPVKSVIEAERPAGKPSCLGVPPARGDPEPNAVRH